jgi:hypothetical protein
MANTVAQASVFAALEFFMLSPLVIERWSNRFRDGKA